MQFVVGIFSSIRTRTMNTDIKASLIPRDFGMSKKKKQNYNQKKKKKKKEGEFPLERNFLLPVS